MVDIIPKLLLQSSAVQRKLRRTLVFGMNSSVLDIHMCPSTSACAPPGPPTFHDGQPQHPGLFISADQISARKSIFK